LFFKGLIGIERYNDLGKISDGSASIFLCGRKYYKESPPYKKPLI